MEMNKAMGIIISKSEGISRTDRYKKVDTPRPLLTIKSMKRKDCVSHIMPVSVSVITITGMNRFCIMYLLYICIAGHYNQNIANGTEFLRP